MKKTLLLIAISLCCRLLTFSQATSLTVDCQTPGWLSSKINYSDQLTLENITITGFINGTDVKFIRELNLNRKLRGVINLENVNIVAGGEAYYKTRLNSNDREFYTQDSILPALMFINLNSLQKVIFPRSLKAIGFESYIGSQFTNTYCDSVIIHGTFEECFIAQAWSGSNWHVQYVSFPEGVKNIAFCSLFRGGRAPYKLILPSTLEKFSSSTTFTTDSVIIHSASVAPETITSEFVFKKGKIYVPKGTKEKYLNSVFRYLEIIEESTVADSISISDTSINMRIGESRQLNYQMFPEDADTQFTWSSSDGSIAQVTQTGIVKGISPGSAIVKIAAIENPNLYATCVVTVTRPVESVSLDQHILALNVSESTQLSAIVSPTTASNKKLLWTSSDASIASVDEYGTVTALKAGNAYIKATSEDNPEAADSCKVIVNQPVTGITLDKTTLELFGIGTSTQLVATIEPADAVNQQVKWASSNESVCIVANGNVVAVGYGTSIVIATTVDGSYMATCKVTVAHPFEITTQSVAVPVNTLRNIPINVNNHADVKSFKFTVNVPQKVKFNSDALPAQRCSDFDVTTTYNADSTIVWVEGTMTEQALAIGEGAFVLLPIKSSEYIDNYDIWLNNITFVGADELIGTETLPDAILTLRVLNFGDVNNDKKVDISDVNAVINRMLGKSNGGTFIFELADMDENGIIDISDVNAIINLMLGK